ncbi:hypothetical protein [uncultured Ruegeria sp.]|uniref:hypothetical protein n=1 Tax=uncultured Ruegeria sp. TaxID=259304 RepID=UPI0026179DCE|nr:hypothetical protein [uncultured Ruegeria sp.]
MIYFSYSTILPPPASDPTGASKDSLPWLKLLGCFTEIHQYQLRVFVPAEPEGQALRVLTAIQSGHAVDEPGVIAAE